MVFKQRIAYLKRQARELVRSRGRILFPKVKPYFIYLKYLGKGIPFKQIMAMDNLLIFSGILRKYGVEHFLTGGTILGAVRQRSFAGRPGDVDLAILESNQKLFESLAPLLEEKGFIRDPNYIHFLDKFVFTKWRTPHVDVSIYRPCSKPNLGGIPEYVHRDASGKRGDFLIDFSQRRLASIYGYEFMVPRNAEEFIEQQYGPLWRNPDSPQVSLQQGRFRIKQS